MKTEKTDSEKLEYLYQHAIADTVIRYIFGILVILIFLKLYSP